MGKEKIKKKKGAVLLRNKLGKFERVNHEAMKILVNRSIHGLAHVTAINKRGRITLEVDITGWTTLTAYMNASMTVETALMFIWDTLQIAYNCERYGLQADDLCWDLNRVYVDRQGTLKMLYWPMTTLECTDSNPLRFYQMFCGIFYGSGGSSILREKYASYFYQRDYFDFPTFKHLVKGIIEQQNEGKRKEKEREEKDKERQRLQELCPEGSAADLRAWVGSRDGSIKILLDREQTVFGRDRYYCNGVISGHIGVSRQHAVIINKNNQYYLADLESKNGTFLHGIRQTPGKRAQLQNGDEIRLGDVSLIFHQPCTNRTIPIHAIQRR